VPKSIADRVFFDWRLIPHATAEAYTHVYDPLHCCSIVYLQHGDGNYCGQNDVAVTPMYWQFNLPS